MSIKTMPEKWDCSTRLLDYPASKCGSCHPKRIDPEMKKNNTNINKKYIKTIFFLQHKLWKKDGTCCWGRMANLWDVHLSYDDAVEQYKLHFLS